MARKGIPKKRAFPVVITAVIAVVVTAAAMHLWIASTPPKVAYRPGPPAPAPVTPEPAPVPRGEVSARMVFGPDMSPDGKWKLVDEVEMRGNLVVGSDTFHVRRHRLVLAATDGRTRTTILTVEEQRDAVTWEPRPGYRGTSGWTVAGWSPDGSRAYYATTEATDGLGGDYPMVIGTADRLYEVDVGSGTDRLLMTLDSWASGGGLRDVYASEGKALFAARRSYDVGTPAETHYQDLFVSSLTQSGMRLAFSTLRNGGIAAAVFDPTGTRVALVTSARTARGIGHDYTLWELDPATGGSTRIGSVPEFLRIGWSDADTVVLDGREFDL